MQKISDYIDATPRVRNEDIGLGGLDPEYQPIVEGKDTMKVKNTLKEVEKKLPSVNVRKLRRKDSDLYRKLEPFIDQNSKTLSKDLEKIPVK